MIYAGERTMFSLKAPSKAIAVLSPSGSTCIKSGDDVGVKDLKSLLPVGGFEGNWDGE